MARCLCERSAGEGILLHLMVFTPEVCERADRCYARKTGAHKSGVGGRVFLVDKFAEEGGRGCRGDMCHAVFANFGIAGSKHNHLVLLRATEHIAL